MYAQAHTSHIFKSLSANKIWGKVSERREKENNNHRYRTCEQRSLLKIDNLCETGMRVCIQSLYGTSGYTQSNNINNNDNKN